MEQWKSHYLEAIESWDKTHRLVGRSSVGGLLDESIAALSGALASGKLHSKDVLVDVGAGQAVMGYPWLHLAGDTKLITVEPDRKKTAFLLWFRASLPKSIAERWVHLSKTIQNVSCETLDAAFFPPNPGSKSRTVCVARAFSGQDSLVAATQHLNCPIFVFEKKSDLACLEPLES